MLLLECKVVQDYWLTAALASGSDRALNLRSHRSRPTVVGYIA